MIKLWFKKKTCVLYLCLRCGLRAGYMELVNIDPEVMHFVETMLCTDISTPVTGQLALDLMVSPPRPGDLSFHTHTQVRHLQQLVGLIFLPRSLRQTYPCAV